MFPIIITVAFVFVLFVYFVAKVAGAGKRVEASGYVMGQRPATRGGRPGAQGSDADPTHRRV